jgi:ferredoxin
MQRISGEMKQKAEELLGSGAVSAVLGWKKGDFPYDPSPAFFHSPADLEALVYNGFCGGNLSKHLIQQNGEAGKTLVFLKPCDTYSFNQLLWEHHVDREKAYIVGVGCEGMIDVQKLRDRGVKGIEEVEEAGDNLVIRTLYGDHTCPREEALLEKCLHCKGKEHRVYDERIGEAYSRETAARDRFSQVSALEGMTPDERFAFWRSALSSCIRCNACRAACPACTCRTCIFDNVASGVASKASADDFEENLFHIIRAFHVAGRCTDCGECSRACPQGIPLHLLNRKLIKDINGFFGEYQAGAEEGAPSPLLAYSREDHEPDAVLQRKGAASC